MFHVFKSADGSYNYGTELRGRESLYSASTVQAVDRFIRRAKTSHGSIMFRESTNPADSLNSRGYTSKDKQACIDHTNLVVRDLSHIPRRRIA